MNTNRVSCLALAGILAALACGLTSVCDAAPRPPNIVLIFADDLGYGDLGCYGSPNIRTPNLDRMSSEGVRLTQFYVAGSLCSPSRSSLMTGRQQIRVGVPSVLGPESRTGLGTSEITIAAALKQRGYRTACIGKWHLGSLPRYLPTRFGFDHYFGLPYSNDMGRRTPGGKGVPLMRDTEIIEQPVVLETLTQRYTSEALKFIRESKAGPFFLYLPHTFPHVPLDASPRFKGKSARGLYGDVVEEIDWSVGEILRTLAELGLDKDTLVLFTSDNGPWLSKGKDGGSAGFLRDGKATAYEGGVRVPFLARWPGRIPAGRSIDQPAWTPDMFPTLVHLGGGNVPTDRPYDGQDIMDVLTGKVSGVDREFIYFRGRSAQAIRSGKWKLHVSRGKSDEVTSTALYDLVADPGERTDRAGEQPAIVERLRKRALDFEAEVRREDACRRAAENDAPTTETVEIGGDRYEVEWIGRETFDGDDWTSRWAVEGNSTVEVRGGRLGVRRSAEAPTTCAATIWYRRDLPGNVLVRFRARAVKPAEGNYANLNLFLCAREADGSELRFGRSGVYAEYHKIPNYIVTFVGGDAEEGWSRVRRDPGFEVLGEASRRSEIARDYSIAVSMCDGVLRYYVDGERIHRVADPRPLPAGKFGLRTFRTDCWWDDIEFGRVLDAPEK